MKRKRPFKRVGGDDFVHVRVRSALSQVVAADLLRVSLRTLRNWETGTLRRALCGLQAAEGLRAL